MTFSLGPRPFGPPLALRARAALRAGTGETRCGNAPSALPQGFEALAKVLA